MNTSKKPLKFLQLVKGDCKSWIYPKQRGLNIGCCECGLVHRFNFRVVKWTQTLKEYKKEIMPSQYQVEFQMLDNDFMTNKVRKKEFQTI